MQVIDEVIDAYRKLFGRSPQVVARAPGRVNFIGEHTDYNLGLVLPFAVDRCLYAAAGPGSAGEIVVHSRALAETVSFSTEELVSTDLAGWQNYIRGVLAGLRDRGVVVDGATLCITGDLPPGRGLSSSAALCVATGMALSALVDAEVGSLDLALLAQRSEHEFAGTPCGIMDPYVCLFGKKGQAVLIDCRSKTHEYIPLELPDCEIVLVDSGVKHELSSGAYQQRVEECRRAAEVMAGIDSSIRTLRQVSEEFLEEHWDQLDQLIARRARHVITENARVLQTVSALQQGHLNSVGQLLFAGHRSLRDDYEVSCQEIEELMTVLSDIPGLIGARMVGGGFGGSILAVVRCEQVAELCQAIEESYYMHHTPSAQVSVIHSADGAECIKL